ncbi:MAG: hypothetical protein K0Q73_2359 [Paenibacillus sp.]|jgi:hypothetical protein|nr:hypothetical protein [Paenibacillus sp.]
MDKSYDYDRISNDANPTKPGEEAISSTDMVSEAVEEIMDNIKKAFSTSDPDDRD